MEFIAEDEKSKKIKKLANMLKELDVNVYIYGENGVGKTYLANFIAGVNDLIIENFDKLKKFVQTDKRIIATGSMALNENLKEKYDINVEIFLDNLKERPKDTQKFVEYFTKRVKNELKIEYSFDVKIDISENLISLKRSVYKSALQDKITKEKLIEEIEEYFSNNEMPYAQALQIFDKGLIEAFSKKYSSKLQMSKALEINRGTLAKKMEQL
jgi:DNA-binding NtrC family response regulator